MADLKKRRCASILNHLASFKVTSQMLNNFTEDELNVRLEVLTEIKSNFETSQSSLEEDVPDEIDGNARLQFSLEFYTIRMLYTTELKARNPNSVQSSTARHTPDDTFLCQSSQNRSRLPLLQIPKFSGSYMDWPDFYSIFNTTIHNNIELSNIERFQHLRAHLKDAALESIRSIELSEQNYETAIQILKNRFENKRLTFQSHINTIMQLKDLKSPSGLRELSDKLNANLRALQSLGTWEQIGECLLMHVICNKFDKETRVRWEEAAPSAFIPTWDLMSTFLEKRCCTLEVVNSQCSSQEFATRPSNSLSKFSKRSFVSTVVNSEACPVCNSNEHAIIACPVLLKYPVSGRYQQVKGLRLCFNCLKAGHISKDCKSGRCRFCSSSHHSILHKEKAPGPSASLISMTSPESIQRDFVFLATARVLVKNSAGALVPCRALLDSASQLHFVTSRLANQLQLKRRKITTIISGIGQSDFSSDQEIEISLQSLKGDFKTTLSAVVAPTITDRQPSQTVDILKWNIPNNINLADPCFFKSERIDLLIGANLFFELLSVGQIRLGENLPMLQKTRLGWVVSGGGSSSKAKSTCLSVGHKEYIESEVSLNKLVSKFWEIEECPEQPAQLTKEEMDCEMHFIKNHIRLDSGEYAVRLPLKTCLSKLGGSYQQALVRFKNLERRLHRKPELLGQYSDFIAEYSKLGHLTMLERMPEGFPMYFLPHHCVLKADSSTTKLRVVFDGSAATSSGVSLNDVLMAGPTIQPKLFTTLLRFRTFKVALTGDICKMYRCVRVSPPDDLLQCILWRENPTDPVKICKLETVTYGTKPASFLAIRAMQQLSKEEEDNYPIGSKIVCRDFYVDDMISGGSSVEEVHDIMKQTRDLLAKGKFQLRKWCTNYNEVLDDVSDSEKEPLVKFHDGSDVTKTLGLVWDPSVDCFMFSFIPVEHKCSTKRAILSTIAKYYDPLGLIGPIITKAKIFMQAIWKEKLDWDESLPQVMQSHWAKLYDEFQYISHLKFPRFIMNAMEKLELHAFCDASIVAYGACVYVRSEYDGVVRTKLLCSKSRVAPLKTLTIPKLELSAALLLSQLVKSIKSYEIVDCPIHCWSDSTIVLSWIHDQPSDFNVFVANRISSIQSLTRGMSWHYVPSKLNPADILSKGSLPKELIVSCLWKNGPTFLNSKPEDWPPHPAFVPDSSERKRTVLLVSFKPIDYSLECKFLNCFPKIQRVFAYVYKFCNIRTLGAAKLRESLTAEDIRNGTHFLIRVVQRSALFTEYKSLKEREAVSASSSLHSLHPFIDAGGVIRVGGRLQNSALPFESRHPMILPKEHPLSEAVIRHFHNKYLHAGPQTLLASIRLYYWPIGGRKYVSRIVNKCVRCFRVKPKSIEHLMGNLPADRVNSARAFSTTGVDFCGPFFVSSEVRNRAPSKCYVSLFICFATKAVHLELVRDLTTVSFLAALKRFCCIRGMPNVIWSDNATNFVGSKNELGSLKALFLSAEHNKLLQQHCTNEGFGWKFIPPRSPHFGGLWEASVKLAKFHFYRLVGNTLLTFEELRTLVCQIAAVINSRPLCPISENPDDLEVLTPGHFLIGSSFVAVAEPDCSKANIDRLTHWQKVCFLHQLFWKKWSVEYLTLLQQRHKWSSSKGNVEVGNLVLLREENIPSMKWPIGRVNEVILGADGVARVAFIKTKNGIVKRAVSKLCLLPVEKLSVESLELSRGEVCSDLNLN